MANSIPRSYLKEITDALTLEPLKVALFSDAIVYDPLALSNTYTAIAALGGEVSPTVGGYALTGLLSSVITDVNAVKLTADITQTGVNAFTARYALLYENSTKKVRALLDFGENKVVSSGQFSIEWSTLGIVKISFV